MEPSTPTLPHIQLPAEQGRRAGASAAPALPGDDFQDSDQQKPRILHLGLDWGTARTVMIASWAGETTPVHNETLPTLVGYAKDGIVENLLPGNPEVLFAQDAVRHRLHLKMAQPVVNGMMGDAKAARLFAEHLRERLPHGDHVQIRAVVGIPCGCDAQAREDFREALDSLVDGCILIPKPFLAAIGARQNPPPADVNYVDPIRNSLLVDLGAGATDVCVIQGCYPSAVEQIHICGGGDALDEHLQAGLQAAYPDIQISPLKLRELKEQSAWAGTPEARPIAELFVRGRLQRVDMTQIMGDSCHRFLEKIAQAMIQLIGSADVETAPELISNILLTGGGSKIRNICRELERLLHSRGIEQAKVRLLGEAVEGYVAVGALKASQQARENQWQLSLK